MDTLELTAPDISCEHCKRSIEQDLGGAPGVARVDVAIDTKMVRIDYDETTTNSEELRSALAAAGYPPA